jgi:hypothetical protein
MLALVAHGGNRPDRNRHGLGAGVAHAAAIGISTASATIFSARSRSC